MTIAAPSIIASNPGVSNVILTSAEHFRLSSRVPDYQSSRGSLGLQTIAAALRFQGFERVSVAQPVAKEALDLARDQLEIADFYKGMGAAEEGAIIGISATSNDYYKFEPLARLLGGAFPKAQLIAGGPAFVRDEIDGAADVVELTLRKGLVHAIQVGRSRTFTDFVVKHRGRLDEVDGPGFYRLDPMTHDIVGRGVGLHPHLGQAPFESAGPSSIRMLLGDTCGNGCDFCSAPKSGDPLFSIDQFVEGLDLAVRRHRTAAINLCDPNPIGRRHLDFYREAFRVADERVQRTIKYLYIDPATLVDEDHFERVLQLAHEGRFWCLYAGRDAVLESQADAIGTRFEGKLKDQAMLDAEKSALMRFVASLKTFHPRLALMSPREITISYIVTPFDTDETAKALFEDSRDFLSLADATMKVKFLLHPLMPYYGTRLRYKNAHLIDLEQMDFQKVEDDTVTPWKKDAGPGLELMRWMLVESQKNQDSTDAG